MVPNNSGIDNSLVAPLKLSLQRNPRGFKGKRTGFYSFFIQGKVLHYGGIILMPERINDGFNICVTPQQKGGKSPP